MSFYVHLPSNASMAAFPNNKQTDFTTVLATPIKLNGKYEVALSEISYLPLLDVDFGKMAFPNFNIGGAFDHHRLYEYELSLDHFANGSKTEDLVDELNRKIKESVLIKEYEYRFELAGAVDEETQQKFHNDYNDSVTQTNLVYVFNFDRSKFQIIDIEDSFYKDIYQKIKSNSYNSTLKKHEFTKNEFDLLEKEFNNKNVLIKQYALPTQPPEEFSKFIKSNENKGLFFNNTHIELNIRVDSARVKRLIPRFSYFNNILSITIERSRPLVITGNLAVLLKGEPFLEIKNFTQFFVPNLLDIVNYAAVYTDIVEDQYFGDSFSPLLRVIHLGSEKHVVTFFENPIYVPVNKTYITTINIKVYDLQGQPIPFKNNFAFVMPTLHFRKKNE